MSSTEEKPNPFYLKNTKYNPNVYSTMFLIAFVSFVVLIVLSYYTMKYSQLFLLIPIPLITFIYFSGVSYSEYQAKFDYIKTTTSGVEYHHSPKISHGWLPKSGLIRYSDIKSIRIIQIKTGLDLLEERMKQAQFQADGFIKKPLLLEITLKNEKVIRIGERLSSSGLIQAAVFIESGAKLGDLFKSFSEKFPNVANAAKNLFSKFIKKS